MIEDKSKSERQEITRNKWRRANGLGIFEAATSFGKTLVPIGLIQSMNQKYPERNTIIVVPSTKLKEDWERQELADGEYGHIKEYKLLNIQVIVVNTYVKYHWDCYLLVCDEVHHYSNEQSKTFSTVLLRTNYQYMIGLTATLNNRERQFLSSFGVPIIDTVTPYEAEKNGWIAKSVIYNLGLELNEDDRIYYDKLHSMFNGAFAKFEHNFHLAQACRMGKDKPYTVDGVLRTGQEWRDWWAGQKMWPVGDNNHQWSPINIAKYARWFGQSMDERKKYLHNHPLKLEVVGEIVKKFKLSTIIFSNSQKFAEDVTTLVGRRTCVTYHSNLPTEIRDKETGVTIARSEKVKKITKYRDFSDGSLYSYKEIKEKYVHIKLDRVGKERIRNEAIVKFQTEGNEVEILSTVRALDEGFDVRGIKVAIMAAYYSTPRQDIQRRGRASRYQPGKLALIVNLYIKKTQEQDGWLRYKQEGTKSINWVDSVDQITIQETINYGNVSLI